MSTVFQLNSPESSISSCVTSRRYPSNLDYWRALPPEPRIHISSSRTPASEEDASSLPQKRTPHLNELDPRPDTASRRIEPEPRIQNLRSSSLIVQADGAKWLDRSPLHETNATLKLSLSPAITESGFKVIHFQSRQIWVFLLFQNRLVFVGGGVSLSSMINVNGMYKTIMGGNGRRTL